MENSGKCTDPDLRKFTNVRFFSQTNRFLLNQGPFKEMVGFVIV